MTEAFGKLKAQLESQGTLSAEDIAAAEAEHGAMTDDERLWLSIELHDRMQRSGDAITVEQYLAATTFNLSFGRNCEIRSNEPFKNILISFV